MGEDSTTPAGYTWWKGEPGRTTRSTNEKNSTNREGMGQKRGRRDEERSKDGREEGRRGSKEQGEGR